MAIFSKQHVKPVYLKNRLTRYGLPTFTWYFGELRIFFKDIEHEYQWNGEQWVRTFNEQIIPERLAMIPGMTIGEFNDIMK